MATVSQSPEWLGQLSSNDEKEISIPSLLTRSGNHRMNLSAMVRLVIKEVSDRTPRARLKSLPTPLYQT
jgi:hypothetical protein